MTIERYVHRVVGTLTAIKLGSLPACERDERGLSQSTENVILLVGAVTIAAAVIALVTNWVNNHLTLTVP